MATKRKATRRNHRKSLKGKWGKVGAPPIDIKFPTRPFTYKQLFKFRTNGQACELTIRDRVADKLADGSLTQLDPRKQPKQGVGRPSDLFVLTAHLGNRTPFVKATVEIVSTLTVPASTPEPVAVNVTEIVTAAPAPPEVVQPEVVASLAPEPAPRLLPDSPWLLKMPTPDNEKVHGFNRP